MENITYLNNLLTNIIYIGSGLVLTLEIMLAGFIIGLTLAIIFTVLRRKRYFSSAINAFISVIRGTPLILQLSLVYFAAPGLIGLKLSILSAGILTFGLNSAAYIAEILRSGIESLPNTQFEAAQTLQISTYYMYKDIILPQVFKNTLPSMIHELISLLKETALISTIGGPDLMRTSQLLAAEKFTYFMPLCIAGVYYYILVLIIEFIGKKIAKRLTYVKN